MQSGAELIVAERKRHTEEEGWTPEHDDQHTGKEMAYAAIAYVYSAMKDYLLDYQILRYYWPWDPEWWKPKDPIRDLVRAGALIAAEIDRLQRLSEKEDGA